MPQHDFRKPRLFVEATLAAGETVPLAREQSNYLGNVLRLSAGETVLAFNGRDGEWIASIAGRKRPDSLEIMTQTRPQDRLPDLAYVFAPLKHARLDYMVQKAIEMGASSLQPVFTRFTQVSRVNSERMRANVIEAAEQCGILSIATVAEPITLDRYLGQREPQRLLVFCDEAADVANPWQALQGEPTGAPVKVRGNLLRVELRHPFMAARLGVNPSFTYDLNSKVKTVDASTYLWLARGDQTQTKKSIRLYAGVRAGYQSGPGGFFATIFAGPSFGGRP